MQTLTYKVDGQTLMGVNVPQKVKSGSSDVLGLKFDISSSDWNKCKLIAEFNDSVGVPVKNCICKVPKGLTERSILKFKLYGFAKNDYKIVTNAVYVELG